jgi:DNA-binding XRE family transcriptional regulator
VENVRDKKVGYEQINVYRSCLSHRVLYERQASVGGSISYYEDLADEYLLVRELLTARSRAGLTQEQVAQSIGTTKSAISRLEAAGKHSPSVATLKKYAEAVGCQVEIRLLPVDSPTEGAGKRAKARR